MNILTEATKEDFRKLVAAASELREVRAICVHNVDDDGDVQNDLVVGREYIMRVAGDNFDFFEVDSDPNSEPVWESFTENYGRWKFFKLKEYSDVELLAKKELEAESTDVLIERYKTYTFQAALMKIIIAERVKGII
jgi:hypothetical protein